MSGAILNRVLSDPNWAADRIEELETALHAAFMAMCNQRDTPDEEVFQDAIDALGMAAREQNV